jgi:putative serine protease PepD
VTAVGAGSAILASLLTAGLVSRDQGSSAVATGSSSNGATQSQAQAPVTSGNVTSPDWVAVAAAVEPSVVAVMVQGNGGSGEGSGVVLDSQGRILTNNHVVAGAGGGSIEVVLSDGRGYAASVVGTDPATDLAVLKLDTVPSGLAPAALGDSSGVKVGDPVMAVGNPLGLADTVTTGIVSALDRPVSTQNQASAAGTSDPVVTNAIQTDAAINPGNSGGALVNGRGQVIGITSSIASLGASLGGQAGSIGLGFAIPINEAKSISSQLIAGKTVQHAWLGVQLTDGSATLDGADRQAALVHSVVAGSPAATAGLKQGDAIIALDGRPLGGVDALIATIREMQPGATVKLTVVRSGSGQDIPVQLGTK